MCQSVCPIARNSKLCSYGKSFSLLVKEDMANIGIPLNVFFGCFDGSMIFFLILLFFWGGWGGLGVFANHSTVHSAGVSRGRVCGCCCWR